MAERWQRWVGPVVGSLAIGIVAAYVAMISTRDADSLLLRINIENPPLAELPPSAGSPQRAPLTRRVVLLVIDGLSMNRSMELPALQSLRELGVATVATSHLPSLSRPNYVSILTGVPPRYSGVRSNDYRWQVPLDSLLHRVRASGRQTAFATDAAPGFGSMFSGQLSEGVATPWSGGLTRAGLLALDRHYPLVVLIPGAVDDAGHRSGAASPAYHAAALEVDRQLRELMAELDFQRDTMVVTADHGHMAQGGHGGAEPEVMEVPLVLAGAGIRQGAQLHGARLIDLAPTMAALLGTSAPRHALGRTLVEALAIAPQQADALAAADQRRLHAIEGFLHSYPIEARPLEVRLFACIALALLLWFVVLLSRHTRAMHFERRLIAVAALGYLPVIAVLVLCSGADLSLSTLPNRADGTRWALGAAAVATTIHLGSTLWMLRGRPLRQRLAAANALALIGLCTAVLVSTTARALVGSPPWINLPSAAMLFFIPLVHLGLAIYALGIIATITLEMVIFAARFEPR
jgi:hypothetical protein